MRKLTLVLVLFSIHCTTIVLSQCEGLFDFPDTVFHCTNDPVILSPILDTPCLSAFSLELDGGNDRVTWNTGGDHFLSQGREDFTWSGWWKMETNPNNNLQFLWEEGDSDTGWNLYHTNGTLYAGWWIENDTSAWAEASLTDAELNEWTHVALTADATDGTWSLWINGSLATEISGWDGMPVHTGNATLGAGGSSLLHTGQTVNEGGGGGPGGGIQYEWDGWADEAAYWSSALDSTELSIAMACPLDMDESLEAAWLFEPGDEYEAIDFSGNGWTGNMQGSELVAESPDAWPYTYEWSTGANTPGLSIEMGNGFDEINSGWVYLTIYVNDSTACTDSTYALDWNPNVIADITMPSCIGYNDGAIAAVLDGGTAPYTIDINGNFNLDSLTAGQYQIQVTDAAGCDDNANIFVQDPDGTEFDLATTLDDCTEAMTGTVAIDFTSTPNGPATIDWDGINPDSLSVGAYEVMITDSVGCMQTASFDIGLDFSNCPNCEEGIDLIPDTLWDCFQGPSLVVANTLECPNLFVLELDGSNDRVEIGMPQGGPGGGQANPLFQDEVVAITFSIDFQAADLNGKQVLYKEGDENAGWVAYLDGDSLRAGWWDDQSSNPEGVWAAVGGVTADEWMRAGCAIDATNGELWVGLEGGTSASVSFTDTLGTHPGGGIIGATGDLRFHDGVSFAGGGGGGFNWNHEFEGLMDQFALWDMAMDYGTWNGVSYCPEATNSESLMAFHSFESDANDVSLDEGFAQVNGEYQAGSNNTANPTAYDGTYLWSTGATDPFDFLEGSNDGNEFSLFYSADGITGCVDSIIVFDWNPNAFIVELTSPSCEGLSNGSVELALDGGTEPYSWTLFGGADPNNLSSGQYNAIVMDAAGCDDFIQFVIDPALPWDVEVVTEGAPCIGEGVGSAEAFVDGNVGETTYIWDGLFTTFDAAFDSLDVGPHFVEITDSLGCNTIVDFDIAMDGLDVTVNAYAPGCLDGAVGSADVLVEGADGPYTIDWNGADSTDLAPGSYTILVADSIGCSTTVDFLVDGSVAINLEVEATAASCFGLSNGTIDLIQATGGSGGLTIDWDGAGVDGQNVMGGSYLVSAMDANGCYADTLVVVDQPDALDVGDIAGPTDIILNIPTAYSYTGSSNVGTTVYWAVLGGTLTSTTGDNVEVIWEDMTDAFLCVYEIDENGCSSEIVCLEGNFTVDVAEELSAGSLVHLYPQPASAIVQIELPQGTELMRVLDLNGRVVHEFSTQNRTSLTLFVNGWSSGMYIVEAISANETIRERLSVRR